MADYIVNIGTQFDTEGLRKYQQQAKKAGEDAAKAFDGATKGVKKLDKEVDKTSKNVNKLGSNLLKISKIGVTAGFGIAAAGMALIVKNTMDAEREMALLTSVIESTGMAAGYTADQIDKMSNALSRNSTFSAGEINEAASRMLTYTDIVGEEFPRAMQNAIDWATRYGVSVTQAAETIGKAIQKPSAAAGALAQQGFKFTKEFIDQLKQLESAGRLAEAQALMFEEIESGVKGAAEAMRNTFGGAVQRLKNKINDLMTGDKGSLDKLKDSVENLITVLDDPKTGRAFASAMNVIEDAAAGALDKVANFINFVSQRTLSDALIKGTVNPMELSIDSLNDSIVDIEKVLRNRPDIIFDNRNMKDTLAQLKEIRDIRMGINFNVPVSESSLRPVAVASPTFTPTPKVDNSAQRERNKLDQEYASILKSLEPSLDTYTKAFLDINTLYATGKLDVERYHEALEKIAGAEAAEKAAQLKQEMEAQKKAADDMLLRGNQMIQQAALQLQYETEMSTIINDGIVPGSDKWITKVLELNEQYRITQLILEGYSEAQAKQIANQEMLAERQRELNVQAMEQTDAYTDALTTAGKHIGNAFSQMMEGQKVNFKNMIHQMAVDLAKSQLMKVLSRLGSSMGGGWGSLFSAIGGGFANGGAFSNGVQMFANGGVVNGVTPFGMAGGKLGIMGEAGPEAIMPLKRGSDGKLGVAATGGGGSNISIVNNVTINGSDSPAESAELTTKALEKMMDSKIKQVIQDQKRTGNMLGQ